MFTEELIVYRPSKHSNFFHVQQSPGLNKFAFRKITHFFPSVYFRVSDISTRSLTQASVKSVGRVQILDHLPVWRVQFLSPRNYLNIKIMFLHSFLARKFLNLPFLIYKILYSERQVTYYIRLNNMASL